MTKHVVQVGMNLANQSKDTEGIVNKLSTNFADHGPAAQKGWQQFIEQASRLFNGIQRKAQEIAMGT